MLKFMSPLHETNNLKTKCGEIHFKTSNFYFLCIFCGSNMDNYNAFKIHFQSEHFNEFVHLKVMTENSEKFTINQEFTPVKTNQEDPLDWNIPTFLKETAVCEKTSIPQLNIENEEIFKNDMDSKINETLTINSSEIEQSSCKVLKEISTDDVDIPDESEAIALTDSGSINSDSKVDWNKPRTLKHYKRPYKPRDKQHSCTYCERTFRRRYQLDTHINIHTGIKPHQCEICGRQFRAVTTLQRHLSTHEQRSIFVCKFCYKSFTHKAALLSHESRHTQERNVPCDECEKLFYTSNQCDTHKRRVHKRTNETLPFACDLCPNRYRTASMLSTHKKRKHNKTSF